MEKEGVATNNNNNNTSEKSVTFDELFKEKCYNLVKFILENTIFLGEWKQKAETFGDKLADHLVLEIVVGYTMLIILMDKQFNWTPEKLDEAEKDEKLQDQLLTDLKTLFEKVGKGPKLAEAIVLKDGVDSKKFYNKLFRYYVFFARVTLLSMEKRKEKNLTITK